MKRNNSNNYSDQDYMYAYPFNWAGRSASYINPAYEATYTWNYGEAVKLPFVVPEGCTQYKVRFTVYSLDFEPLFTVVTKPDEDGVAYLEFDESMSSQIGRAAYYCSAECITEYDFPEKCEKEICLFMPANTCVLRVV